MSIPRQDEEAQLIRRAQRGDLNAFNQIVLLHQDSAFTVAYRVLGDTDQAADVTQEAFISANRRLNTFRGGSFRAWMLTIVRNRALDVLRSQRRHPAQSLERGGRTADLDPEPLEIADESLSPEDRALQAELRRAIQECILALGAEQRAVLVLSDVEGLAYEEIAAQLNAQLGTVKSRLSRARANVRDCLQAVRELLPRSYRLSDES